MSDEALPEPGLVLPFPEAWRLGLLGTGTLVLLVQVLFIRDFPTGITATVIGAMTIGLGLSTTRQWALRRAAVHALCALLILASLVGLCSSSCGSYAAYSRFLSLPTSVVGFALHALTALLLWREDRQGGEGRWGDLAIAACIGGSLFYAAILLQAASWCGSCFAVHALMAVQFLSLLRQRQGLLRGLDVAVVLAACGLVNLVYHHRLVPDSRNDAAELVAYLRSARTQTVPLVEIRQRPLGMGAAHRPGDQELERLADGHAREDLADAERALAHSDQLARTEAAASPPVPEALPVASVERRPDQANRWGDEAAPVVALTLLNTGCPACRVQYPQVLELSDLVDKHRLQLRFLLTYKPEWEATQATASLALAAGMRGEQALLATLHGFYIRQQAITVPVEALAALPGCFPRTQAVEVLRRHRAAITSLLKDAVLLQQRLGAQVEPITWLYRRGDPLDRPRRRLEGVQLSAVLRAAVLSTAQEP